MTASSAQNAERQRQMAEAEEVLGDRLANVGFAKGLYLGKFLQAKLLPYPIEAVTAVEPRAAELLQFCRDAVDPVAIDRQAEIPADVIHGLGKLGVLGACVPKEFGGRGLSQTEYCRLVEVLGGHCASTALFVTPIIPSVRGRSCSSARPSSRLAGCRSWRAANGSAPSR